MTLSRVLGADEGSVPAVAIQGLNACASFWLCSACAAKIGSHRGQEVEAGLRAAYERGWGAVMGLVSVPHDNEPLVAVWQRLRDAWGALTDSGRWWRNFKSTWGIEGIIWGDDVTHGRLYGWNPHRHVILITSRPLSGEEASALGAAIVAQLTKWARSQRLPPPVAAANGWTPVREPDVARLAHYVSGGTREKTGAGDELRAAASELARTDRKRGQDGRTRFELLRDAYEACEASGGDLAAAALWFEFEDASRLKTAIRWSNGLKVTLGVREATDEEAVREVVAEGPVVETCEVLAGEWTALVVAVPGREVVARLAFRDGGSALLFSLLGEWGRAGPIRYMHVTNGCQTGLASDSDLLSEVAIGPAR